MVSSPSSLANNVVLREMVNEENKNKKEGSGQPGLVVDDPAHGGGVETR